MGSKLYCKTGNKQHNSVNANPSTPAGYRIDHRRASCSAGVLCCCWVVTCNMNKMKC